MSHYTKGVAHIDDPECLIEALGELGWGEKLEVYAEPQHLIGFQGDVRPEVAHVVIRRRHIDSAANDVGFLFKADGSVETIISDYDSRRFSPAWVRNLQKLAAVHKAIKQAQLAGHRAVRQVHPQTGKIQVVVSGGRW